MDNIEKKLLSMIDLIEQQSKNNSQPIDFKLYLQLADLYKFHKDFNKESQILNRYVRLDRAGNDDLLEIYSRIEKSNQLHELVLNNPVPIEIKRIESIDNKMKLIPVFDDVDEEISLSSKQKIIPRVDSDKKLFNLKSHKVLSVCAVCTGRSDQDEVIQLALELFCFDPRLEKPLHVLESFVGFRQTQVSIPGDMDMKFNLSQVDKKKEIFDKDKIESLFYQADFVVSHNDADIERKLIATLIPEVAIKPWYSSQKDIPWTALGFKSSRLTQLAVNLGDRTPRSSLDRAVAIRRILVKTEVDSSQIYLERLYNMHPMKAFKWSMELTKQHKKLKNAPLFKRLKISLGLAALVLVFVIGSLYWVN